MLKVTILIDNPRSWFVPYGAALGDVLRTRGHEVAEIDNADDIPEGDIAFFLSCERIIGKDLRSRNTHNLVIHGSALPQGKGWSPLTWQILEGKSEIPLTLFEAVDKVDAGGVYEVATIHFEGHELIDELRQKEGQAIIELALRFVDQYPKVVGEEQKGEESFYSRRTSQDSELDPEKSIAEQFNLLRVVDNERYPAFFRHRGHMYRLKVYKADQPES